MANYFITSMEDPMPSAIEIAQAKRVKLFNANGQTAKIVETEYNNAHAYAQRNLGTEGKVINLYQYFQNLNYQDDPVIDRVIINQITQMSGYELRNNAAYKDNKLRLKIGFLYNRLYSIDYYDRYGFLDRTDYYDQGCLSFTDFYEDKGRLVLTQYYNDNGKPIILMHYRGGEGNSPILTLIQLYYRDVWHNFDSATAFRAYFFDELAQNDLKAVFFADRSERTLYEFQQMKQIIPRYLIFHSSVTVNGQRNGRLFGMYECISDMLNQGSLNGLISSTNQEADDVANIFKTNHSYAIPVTYASGNIKPVSFANRSPYNLIAVARLSEEKRLDHIIRAVIKLKPKYPQLNLTFYGYEQSTTDKVTGPSLHNLVIQNHAQNYIHFAGFQNNLDNVYNNAWLEILTSKYEGFAMALLEAQEHGCPAVAYNINYGPKEIITDNYTGKLVQAGNEAQLAQTLNALLSHPAILADYSKNAYSVVRKYSFSNVANAWHNFELRENLVN